MLTNWTNNAVVFATGVAGRHVAPVALPIRLAKLILIYEQRSYSLLVLKTSFRPALLRLNIFYFII